MIGVSVMGWFWFAVAVVLAALFGGFGLYDRRARRRGHRGRSSAAIATDVRERKRDRRAFESQQVPGILRPWMPNFRSYEASDHRHKSG
jgi:hypothetical protein